MIKIPFVPTYAESMNITGGKKSNFNNAPSRAIFNVGVIIAHQFMLKDKKLVPLDRKDPSITVLNGILKARKIKDPYDLDRDHRINVDLTNDNYIKLEQLMERYHLKTKALALSFCIRSLRYYINQHGPRILDKWADVRESKDRDTGETKVTVNVRLPISLLNICQERAIKSNTTVNKIVVELLKIGMGESSDV